jgi:hypothetical protein
MTVLLENNVIHLRADCPVEDAEPLCSLLQDDRKRLVDLSQAGFLHTAVVQVLVVMAPTIRGSPSDPFARDWIVTHLARA